MKSIVDRIGKAAVYEQLAEECVELAKAALKMARIIRGENPTRVSRRDAESALIEEYTDICVCAEELNLHMDMNTAFYKRERWHTRIDRMEEAGKGGE